MAKLVEILAREYQWDVLATRVLVQDGLGDVFTQEGRYPCGFFEMADDWQTAEVTRAQWEAERARIAESDRQFIDAHKDAPSIVVNVEFPSEPACGKRSKEDQALWDKVALNLLTSFISAPIGKFTNQTDSGVVIADSFELADAFMEERAKRLKGGE